MPTQEKPTKKLPKTATKQRLYDEYEKVHAALKEAQKNSLNPATVKKAKRKKEVIEQVTSLNLDAVEKSLGTLRGRLNSVLQDLEDSLRKEVEGLNTVQEGLQYKQEELKDIFDIEHEASTLAALIQAQDDRQQEFEQELAAKRQSFKEEQDNLRKLWEQEKAEQNRLQKLQAQRDQEERQRELEQHKYSFEREERSRLDALEDDLKSREKAFVERIETAEKDLQVRTDAVVARETSMKDLEDQVVTLQNQMVQKVEEAVESTKKSMNTSAAIARNALEKEFNAQTMVLEGKLETVQDRLEEARTRIQTLESDLSNARSEVNAVARAALEASSGRAALEAVQSASRTDKSGK